MPLVAVLLAENAFGRSAAAAAAAVRSISECLRSNIALHQLDLRGCGLNDQGVSLLAGALAIRNVGILNTRARSPQKRNDLGGHSRPG
jgi:hypothetical protein